MFTNNSSQLSPAIDITSTKESRFTQVYTILGGNLYPVTGQYGDTKMQYPYLESGQLWRSMSFPRHSPWGQLSIAPTWQFSVSPYWSIFPLSLTGIIPKSTAVNTSPACKSLSQGLNPRETDIRQEMWSSPCPPQNIGRFNLYKLDYFILNNLCCVK